MTAQELTITIQLDDGTLAEARVTDPAAAAALSAAAAEASGSGATLRLQAVEAADTAGHAFADDTLAVSVGIEGDVQGHTMTLRFPSAEEAKRFQKRLIIGGVLAATIAVGAVGAQLATQGQAQPLAGPAVVAPAVVAPATRVAPERGVAITPAKDAKDAKDAARLSGSAALSAEEGVTRHLPGNRGVMPK